MAFFDQNGYCLRVLDGQTNLVTTIASNVNWRGVNAWLGNEYVLVEKDVSGYGNIRPGAKVIVNVDTYELQEFPPEYPYLVHPLGDVRPDWYGYTFSATVYSPALDQVAYAADAPRSPVIDLVLWDLPTNREVTRLPAVYMGSTPQWNRDGSRLLASAVGQADAENDNWYQLGYDLFLLDRNGAVERLTFLSQTRRAIQNRYSWSSDETQLSFWLFDEAAEPAYQNTFALLDLNTSQITSLCTSLDNGMDEYGYYRYPMPSPIWSPDSRYIMVTSVLGTDRYGAHTRLFIIDLQERLILEVADEVTGLGWFGRP